MVGTLKMQLDGDIEPTFKICTYEIHTQTNYLVWVFIIDRRKAMHMTLTVQLAPVGSKTD